MGLAQAPSASHLYPQALQLKLYQAFIFSIPVLFSIILFLLFYLFYLKRRTASLSAHPPILPRTLNEATLFATIPGEVGLKDELKDKLPIVLVDEELRARDSQCCVCLGEFMDKEELHQVPSCKHVFHIDCIRHWLHSNATCPLCRCSVIPSTEPGNIPEPMPSLNSNQIQQRVLLGQEHQQQPQEEEQEVLNFWS